MLLLFIMQCLQSNMKKVLGFKNKTKWKPILNEVHKV